MPNGQSTLAIRDSELSPPLASPTTISGTVDDETGVISGVTLSTPPLEFETTALGFPVDVKATFTQVAPGIGLVSATKPAALEGEEQKGAVALRTSVVVGLDLTIYTTVRGGAILLQARCETPPVALELLSTTPYTQSAGGRIVDANFEIPPVPVDNPAGCISEVAGGVNGLLAGAGHSLSLAIKGDLPVPPLKADTTTTLSVDPSDGTLRGSMVTLTAAVAEVEPNDADPTGTVVFREGSNILGTALLQVDGTATLVTKDLRAGDRSLTAAYQGDGEFNGSESAPVVYAVAPAPILTGSFPEFITRGGAPIEFDVTVDNSGSTRAVANGRVDVVFPGVSAGTLVLEQQLPDTTWAPVTMLFSGPKGGPAGTLGPDDGVLVPAGVEQTYHLRVRASNGASIRSAEALFSLVTVDPESGDAGATVANTSWPYQIVLAARAATTTTVGMGDSGLYDMALRPGQTLFIETYVNVTADGAPVTTGRVEFLIDGVVVPFRPDPASSGPLSPERTRETVTDSGFALAKVTLPSNLAAGRHIVTTRYLGDSSFLPSTSTQHILTVIDPLGPLYTCDMTTIFAERYGAYVQAYVRLPSYAKDGAELDLADLEITVIPGGVITTAVLPLLITSGTLGVSEIEIDLGDGNTIVGDSVTYEPSFDPSDQLIRLQNLEGTIVVDGEPGDVMELPIERIQLSGTELFGANFTFTCTPQTEPALLDEIGVAGVSLTAETSTDPVRAGDDVILTATAAPASSTGVIEFFSGSESLGTASGATGTASITVDDLPVGTNALTARYYGVLGNHYQSDTTEIDVRDTIECPEFAEPGTAATVRLVYLELLGRCPDAAGFDYWKSRLDGGTSPEVFARAISSSPEAVGMVVDDAYVTMLGRKADSAGKAFWVERMISRNGRYDQLLADLGSSAEFWSQAGSSNAGFVGRVYEQLLNRTPDQAGQDFWVGRLNAGTSPRALILSLANLDEPLGVLVSDSYLEILGRGPSVDERTDGIAFLRRTGDRSGLYAQLIGTSEFTTRAQGFPNPED